MTQTIEAPAGCRLFAHDSLDSTSEEAKRLAAQGAGDRTIVWAGEQRSGRGRHGREWSSPPGNLYVSVLFRPGCAVATAPQLGFVIGVAMADAIGELCDVPVQLKWPNDLLAGGRKLSGILLDSAGNNAGAVDWVIAGIGVNIESHPDSVRDATNLAAEGANISVSGLLETFLARLDDVYALWLREGFEPIRAAWTRHALDTGSMLSVKLPDRTVSGTFEGIDEIGNLQVRDGEDVLHVAAGEVFPVSTAAKGES